MRRRTRLPGTASPLSQTASYWDDAARVFETGSNENRAEWQGHPAVQARRQRLLGGRTAGEWLADRLSAPAARALGAGCGAALFELDLVRLGAVEHFDLWDVSPAFLELARDRAASLGISDRVTIRCGDVFAIDDGRYDLVTFVHSLHHAPDVRAAVRFSHDVLRPGGLLFADEYIGPRRFAYPPEHSQPVKVLYRSLSSEIRGEWPELPQPKPADVAAADPTESVESDLILSAINETFHSVETVPLFGALPFILWWGLDHDALWDTKLGREFVELLLEMDEALVAARRLPPYFAIVLAQRSPLSS